MLSLLSTVPVSGTVSVPGSKYQANRALIIAALAQHPARVFPLPDNDDIQRVQDGLRALGVPLQGNGASVSVQGIKPSAFAAARLNAGASGTFARFALALAALGSEPVVIDGSARLRQRPMHDLALALRALGVKVEGDNDALPLTIAGPLRGGTCVLPGHISSQFISALLLAAPCAEQDVYIRLSSPLVSKNYVTMTMAMMQQQGVKVEQDGNEFRVRAGQAYRGGDIALEADPCSASYFMAAAALTGGDIHVRGYNFDSVQGEAQLPRVLEQMGCLIKREAEGLRLMGPGLGLRAVDIDMGDMPDVVQTVAVLAAFAHGVTRLHNIAHLVHKESNRIFDTALELKKMGVEVQATADELIIIGGQPQATTIATHEDHRMAMSFAIAGLKLPQLRIENPQVVEKSFPQFWSTLSSLGVQILQQETRDGR